MGLLKAACIHRNGASSTQSAPDFVTSMGVGGDLYPTGLFCEGLDRLPNSLTIPDTGWWLVGANWTDAFTGCTGYLAINGVNQGTAGMVAGVNTSPYAVLELQAGDLVQLFMSTGSARQLQMGAGVFAARLTDANYLDYAEQAAFTASGNIVSDASDFAVVMSANALVTQFAFSGGTGWEFNKTGIYFMHGTFGMTLTTSGVSAVSVEVAQDRLGGMQVDNSVQTSTDKSPRMSFSSLLNVSVPTSGPSSVDTVYLNAYQNRGSTFVASGSGVLYYLGDLYQETPPKPYAPGISAQVTF